MTVTLTRTFSFLAVHAAEGGQSLTVANDIDGNARNGLQTLVTVEPESILGTTTTIVPPDADDAMDGHQVDLAASEVTSIRITVLAADERSTATYTIHGHPCPIHRRPAQVAEGGSRHDRRHCGCGAGRPNGYPVIVPYSAMQTTVTAATVHAKATVKIQDADDMDILDADRAMDGHQVSLKVGTNEINVVVTAENKTPPGSTYTITVTRAQPADATLTALELTADGWWCCYCAAPPVCREHGDVSGQRGQRCDPELNYQGHANSHV